MWKWNLAFQCVVNIGVRGSENVRTRVVEADMVPVIATILDNYIKVIDKCREKVEADARRNALQALNKRSSKAAPKPMRTDRQNLQDPMTENRSPRRQEPPQAIDIPQTLFSQSYQQQAQQNHPPDSLGTDLTSAPPQFVIASPPERSTFARHHHHHHHYHHRNQDGRHQMSGSIGVGDRHNAMQSVAAAVPFMDAGDGFGIRPVRDIDRLPSMLPALQTGITSQPESPTTPSAPTAPSTIPSTRERRRPSARHQQSNSGDSDDANGEEAASEASAVNEGLDEPMIDIQATVGIQGVEDQDSMLDAVATPSDLTVPNVSEGQEAETFNITHRSAIDGSIINANVTPTNNTIFPPPPKPQNVVKITPPSKPQKIQAT